MGRRLPYLIVVIPGIGGSVLADSEGAPVWGQSRRGIATRVLRPQQVSIAEAPTLTPVDVMRSVGFIPPFQLHGYDALIRRLSNALVADERVEPGGLRTDVVIAGRDPDGRADVIMVPYDFRRGIVVAAAHVRAQVDRSMAALGLAGQGKSLVVIGHSLGGLVARQWLTEPAQARLCEALLTLGTPHLGATKALDWLVNGVRVGPGPLAAATGRLPAMRDLTDVLRAWPTVYELLPTYQVIGSEPGHAMSPSDLFAHGWARNRPQELRKSETLAAAGVHDGIREGWAALEDAVRPRLWPFYARDHDTAHRAELDSTGRLSVRLEDPDWQPNPGWRGDGTVPAISAIPPELARRQEQWHFVRQRHVPMSGAEGVVEALRSLLGQDLGSVRGEDEGEGARLGIGLDDAVLLGEPTVIRARLAGTQAHPGARIHLDAEMQDGRTILPRQELDRDGPQWATEWTPPEPGIWRLTLRAAGVAGSNPLSVQDTMAAIAVSDVEDHAELRWH